MMKQKQILSALKGTPLIWDHVALSVTVLERCLFYTVEPISIQGTPLFRGHLSTQKVTDHKMVDKFRGESRGGTHEARATPYF